jgi:hypothetical protein
MIASAQGARPLPCFLRHLPLNLTPKVKFTPHCNLYPVASLVAEWARG